MKPLSLVSTSEYAVGCPSLVSLRCQELRCAPAKTSSVMDSSRSVVPTHATLQPHASACAGVTPPG